ncbi:DUF433 domain-containing protein [Tautonia marina]|uniref:DUF433 domain-containing protein n=1 Tax=Tautonia marina TaxID=2653855 RepID=UPI0012610347|nr:DUF433 domain-containing protein [Tautonia marina]
MNTPHFVPPSDPSPEPSPTPTSPPTSADAPPAPVPMGLVLLRGVDEQQFNALIQSWLAQFDPSDVPARLQAEMVVIAVERLRRAARLEPSDTLPGLDWCRFQSLAERNYRNACKDLRRHLEQQAAASPGSTKASQRRSSTPPADPAPAPLPPPPESTPEEIADAFANWRNHIALVRSMSEQWPVILRLRREVEDVAAWLADGKTEEELMTWYPGLTRADLAACRACDAEGLCGPFDLADGPYPPGLPVLDDLPDNPSGEIHPPPPS